MTESDWLDSYYLTRLLRMLPGHPEPSERKLRLFGVACARRVAAHLSHPVWPDILDVCEQYADDMVTWQASSRLRPAVDRHAAATPDEHAVEDALDAYHYAAAVGALTDTDFCASYVAACFMDALCGHDDFHAGRGERLYQADLLRDIFGNPFRPVAFAPGWRTADAVGVAHALYAARDFTAARILADALEDAGCDAAELLAHLGGPGEHVRGCWAVDLVLGKG